MAVARRPARRAPSADSYREPDIDERDEDEEDDDEPRVTRRKARDDDEPVRSKRRAAPVDDDEDDDDDEKDEERSPRRTSVKKTSTRKPPVEEDDDDEDDDSNDDDGEDEDEDETPRRGDIIQGGWKAAKKLKESGGDYANDFKFGDEESLVKFLQDEPFAVYQQHWVTREGKQSFICPGKGCPLCSAGDRPRKMYAFNIAVIDGDEVELKSLTAGARLLATLEKCHEGKRGPLTKPYWALARSGNKKAGYTTSCAAVSAGDLEDVYEVDEDNVKALIKELKPYTASILQIPSKADLRKVADELQ